MRQSIRVIQIGLLVTDSNLIHWPSASDQLSADRVIKPHLEKYDTEMLLSNFVLDDQTDQIRGFTVKGD